MILRLRCASDDPRKRFFHKIVIWRRLSHPNVLPVLGVSPKLFPLCVAPERMIDGNIVDFTSNHPEVNRLRLVRSLFVSLSIPKFSTTSQAGRSSERITVPPFDGNHPQRPQACACHCDFYQTSLTISCRQTSSLTAIYALVSPATDSPRLFRIRTLSIPAAQLLPLLVPFDIWHRNCSTPPASVWTLAIRQRKVTSMHSEL